MMAKFVRIVLAHAIKDVSPLRNLRTSHTIDWMLFTGLLADVEATC